MGDINRKPLLAVLDGLKARAAATQVRVGDSQCLWLPRVKESFAHEMPTAPKRIAAFVRKLPKDAELSVHIDRGEVTVHTLHEGGTATLRTHIVLAAV